MYEYSSSYSEAKHNHIVNSSQLYKIYSGEIIMLEKIILKNMHSIGECEMDFRKGHYRFLDENILDEVINPVAIYGHNGSGKSSFLNAIKDFISLLIMPANRLAPFMVNNLSCQDYVAGEENKITGEITIIFLLEEGRYEYTLAVSQRKGIVKESLLKDDKSIFLRDDKGYLYGSKRVSLKDSSKLVSTLRSLAYSEINDALIQRVYAYFSAFIHLDMLNISRGDFITSRLFPDSYNINDLLVTKSEEVKKHLLGFEDFPYYSIKKRDALLVGNRLKDEYLVEIEDGNKKISLPFEMISSGMKNASILLSILLEMPSHAVLFVDEIELALHPSSLKNILNIVREKKIQLVFSSHNTNVLSYLRPDQIYFATWKEGYSTLKRLSLIYPNIREVNNIEKMYLSSYFDEAIVGE